MDVVWGEGWESFAVSSVHSILEKRRAIAYTTVMTTVSRLFDKGLLEREKEGRRYVYTPAMSREEFAEAMARDVMHSLPKQGRAAAMALLVEQIDEVEAAELDRLQELIERRRAELARD